MRNLKEIFLPETDSNPEYDMAYEGIKDGDSASAHEHLISQFISELSELPNEYPDGKLLRFCGLQGFEGYDAILKDILENRITLSNPMRFNDPMDPILKVWIQNSKTEARNRTDKKYFKMARNALKHLRICCMMDSLNSQANLPLMWSHYANSHKGIAIGYEITQSNIDSNCDSNHVLRLCKVKYRNYKPICNETTMDNALLAKASCWNYENEYRLVYFTADTEEIKKVDANGKIAYNNFVSLAGFRISDLYLGTRIDSKKKSDILGIARRKGIVVYQMEYDKQDMTKLNPVLINM